MEDKYKKTMLQLQQYLSNRGGDEQTDDGSSPKHMGVYISGNIMVAIVCPNQGTDQKLQDLVSGLLEMTALDMGPPGTTLAGVQAGISMFKEGNVYKIAFEQGYIAEAVYQAEGIAKGPCRAPQRAIPRPCNETDPGG